ASPAAHPKGIAGRTQYQRRSRGTPRKDALRRVREHRTATTERGPPIDLSADTHTKLAVEIGVDAGGSEELIVRAALDNLALFEHEHNVGVADGAETMRD